jgi:primosomal protein N'
MIPSIAQVVVGLPVEGPFDYLIPPELASTVVVGARVLVRFAGKKHVGIVVRLLQAPEHAGRLSVMIKVLDASPVFSPAFLDLAAWFASRFACTQGEALHLFLPSYLRKARAFAAGPAQVAARSVALLPELVFDRGQVRRWEVLLPRIASVLGEGRGVLVLVPEAARCHDVLPKLGALAPASQRVLMVQGTEKEEYARWLDVRSGRARLVAGFISAVFAPVQDLGLIVVIDEESPFYKNDRSPFYHAREAALERASMEGCALICVSSAPSVEMWHRVDQGKAVLTVLDEKLPPVRCLDLSNFKMKKGAFISPGLRHHTEAVLKQGGKALFYIQAARGIAAVMEEARQCFPSARVSGYDKTSSVLPESADILVATQAVFRHRASIAAETSAVLDIDWEFHKHDHQASQGAFALIQHLRQVTRGQVLLQTRHAADALLHTLATDDPSEFYRSELVLRKEMGLPPFGALATVIVRGADPALACAQAKRLYDMLVPVVAGDIVIVEPQPDRTALERGKFRYSFSLQGPDRTGIVRMVKDALKVFRPKKDVVVTVNVD